MRKPWSYGIRAVAVDNLEVSASSSAVIINVGVVSTVSLSTPSNNQKFAPLSNIQITANASDSDGSIAKVEFYRDAVLIGTDSNALYSYLWTEVPVGNYSLTELPPEFRLPTDGINH